MKWSDLATNAMLADTLAHPPGLSPMEQSRILAMAFLAGHDALNYIEPRYARYALQRGDPYSGIHPGCTYEMAVCEVLSVLLPAHSATFRAALTESFQAAGVYWYGSESELGEGAARAILNRRADDGALNAQGPYTPGTRPGDYQPTPPVNLATFVNWGAVKPFAMSSGSQFRAPPPYQVTEAEYAADCEEVRLLGAAAGATRTAEQSAIAKAWLESTPLSWQRIMADRMRGVESSYSLWYTARVFALVQMAQADAYIASLESKYHYNFWRPITAIRAADSDGNPLTVADPAWDPFDPVTPPVPEYPSAHAAAATAGSGILFNFMLPPARLTYLSSTATAPRVFSSPYYFADDAPPGEDLWSQISREIGLSRIYVGYHFRRAVTEGWSQGQAIADWIMAHQLRSL